NFTRDNPENISTQLIEMISSLKPSLPTEPQQQHETAPPDPELSMLDVQRTKIESPTNNQYQTKDDFFEAMVDATIKKDLKLEQTTREKFEKSNLCTTPEDKAEFEAQALEIKCIMNDEEVSQDLADLANQFPDNKPIMEAKARIHERNGDL